MRIIRHPLKSRLNKPVVALGTFDGVHVGHRQVLRRAVKEAGQLQTHSAVITFDPHPQEIIAPGRGLRLLTTLNERTALFCALGLDSVIAFRFRQELQRLTSREFIERYLVGKLGVRGVVVGYDYAFGRGRHAGAAELKELGRRFGFNVVIVPPVKRGHHLAKSGKIRELLSLGEFNRAVQLLGHPYRITGRVVRGKGVGKKLGFPTANLKVDPRKLIPAEGVYFGRVGPRKCLVNIGSRPTFGAGELLVEVHLLDFRGNLRGQTLTVDLVRRFRAEKQFTDVNDLIAQIKKDVARARRL
ncbi:MAG: bifunctional riboflavin kinase/FAD synthetase [Candidatus Margulisbacteria bacterium]|jgi:riboflavin kinase/FMN adenylyltransferase|nr:bifunctional riboflavin kinase/FAD synthetase [Candidatus Margulisiibacteriota bacterium]